MQGVAKTSRVARARAWLGDRALVLSVALVLILPLVVASAVLYGEALAPIYDLALIEQKVRDVGTAQTPLLGLVGRLGTVERPGSHPGPISFFMLAPVYRAMGSSAWALEVSAAFWNAVALTTAVFVAWRRRSPFVLGAVGSGLALLMQGYGPTMLTEPWNPNFPTLWLSLLLVAVWSAVCGDWVLLPLSVAAASVCAQTHVPYAPLCAALLALATLAVIRHAVVNPGERKQSLGLLVLSLALLIVLWLPPIIEELRRAPGNASRLIEYFSDPNHARTGLSTATRIVLDRFDPAYVLLEQTLSPGGFALPLQGSLSTLRAGAALALWLVCAALAVRLQNRWLWALHGLLLASTLVAVIAASRIVGFPFGHVLYWTWQLPVMLVLACVSTIGVASSRRAPDWLRSWFTRHASALVVAAVALCTLRITWAATRAEPSARQQTVQLKQLARASIDGIERGLGEASGHTGRYIVSWTDAFHGGGVGIGLANELERAGFQVAYEPDFAWAVGAHRTRPVSWATARVHFASGGWVREYAKVPGAVQIAHVDMQSSDDKREAEALRKVVGDSLRSDGKRHLVNKLDYDVMGTMAAHSASHPLVVLAAGRLADLGGPAAVFVLPPQAAPRFPSERAKKRRKRRKRP